MQKVYADIDKFLAEFAGRRALLVCGGSFETLPVTAAVLADASVVARFTDFAPNPSEEQIMMGVRVFQEIHCDALITVGGGSAIDVAKGIKHFTKRTLTCGGHVTNVLKIPSVSEQDILFGAVPTTAGTGSETTRFAVYYKSDVKQSLHDDNIIPQVVCLDARCLAGLPLYQKKCTFLDALCQAIESYWSKGATERSRELACSAIDLLLANYYAYVTLDAICASPDTDAGDEVRLSESGGESMYVQAWLEAATNMLQGSYLAGQAINITTTTAPHAMSYKLTKMYGIPHGHAVALTLPHVWRYMQEHESASAGPTVQFPPNITVDRFELLMTELEMAFPYECISSKTPVQLEEDIAKLTSGVNMERLGNNPIKLTPEVISNIYRSVLTSHVIA